MNSKIKIACVGNMNNSFYAVVRHLRLLGYDAELILIDEFKHFMPEADTYEEVDLKYIKNANCFSQDILHLNKLEIVSFFKPYSFIIASGISIAYLAFASIKIDIVIPYGSDFYELPFLNENKNKRSKVNATIAFFQKRGIETAVSVIWDYTNIQFEDVIDRFNFKGQLFRMPSPFLFNYEFNPGRIEELKKKSKCFSQMESIKLKHDAILFSHSRQCWKNPPDIWSYKGNEKIVLALKDFLDKNKTCNPALIFFEYGPDVEETKKLISNNNLINHVYWFPVIPRKEILTLISSCDIGIGEIGNHSWFSYGAIFEFLCMMKPVIHFRDDRLYSNKISEMYPMYSANSRLEIVNILEEFYADRKKFEVTGQLAYKWYINYAIKRPLSTIIQQIEKKSIFLERLRKIMQTANAIRYTILNKLTWRFKGRPYYNVNE